MKQLLVTIMMLLFGVAGMVKAQVCKLPNSKDNVEVFRTFLSSPTQVTVIVSNDSKDISANVTVEIEVTYGYNTKQTFYGKELAKPNKKTTIYIDIPEKGSNNQVPTEVKAKSISGTKCNDLIK